MDNFLVAFNCRIGNYTFAIERFCDRSSTSRKVTNRRIKLTPRLPLSLHHTRISPRHSQILSH